MEIFYTSASPYARCVRALCVELDIYDKITWNHCHPFDNQQRFLQYSPLGKVPCLLVDGESIFDSDVIIDYIDQRFASGKMLAPVSDDWALSTSYSLLKGIMDVSVARRLEKVREEEGQASNFWLQRHTQALLRSLSYLQTRIKHWPTQTCQLHIHFFCALDYINFRHPDIDWQSSYPHLLEQFNQLSERKALLQTSYLG
jgi:glutathione S-transferase